MTRPVTGSVRLVPGAGDLGGLHEQSIPQKDQLCGAFCGALALTAAGHPIDQDEVALRSGTTLAEGDPAEWLPPGALPKTDYDTALPVAADEASSGTSAPALARSIEGLSGGELAVVPVAGPWTAASVVELVETVAAATSWCTLIANIRTGHLWGSRPPARLLLDHLPARARRAVRMLESIKGANLALRFLLELCALGALGYWGFKTGGGLIAKIGLGIGAPLIAAVVWGTFLSPQAPVRLPGLLVLILQALVFGLAAAGLVATGHQTLALVFVVIVTINAVLMYLWGQ